MIQMRVREKDVERGSRDVISHAKESSAGVEHDPRFGQHEAGRMPTLGRVIAAGSEEEQFHGDGSLAREHSHDNQLPADMPLDFK